MSADQKSTQTFDLSSIPNQKGVFYQKVKEYLTYPEILLPGNRIRTGGGKFTVLTKGIDAFVYTLDRNFVPTWHNDPVTILHPWLRPSNAVYVAEKTAENQAKLTTISAVEQYKSFWIVCEEKIINIFVDDQGVWSPQLFGKTAEVELLLKLDIKPAKVDRSSHIHLKPVFGQVLFWNTPSGSGGIYLYDDEKGLPVSARAFWKDVAPRKSLDDMRALIPGEIVIPGKIIPIDNPKTSFKQDAKEITFPEPTIQ